MTEPHRPRNKIRSKARHRTRSKNASKPAPLAEQMAFQRVTNPMPPLALLSDDHIEAIHHAALKIISEFGIKTLSPTARQHLRDQGCLVDDASQIVRMEPEFVTTMVAKAPSCFTLTPRNPEHALKIGGNVLNFGLVSGPPNVHDAVKGRRAGTLEDFKALVKLGQALNAVHFMGNQACATTDLPANTRHLDSLYVALTLSDKVTASMSIGRGRVLDAIKMVAIARGCAVEDLAAPPALMPPALMTNININSPRVLDQEMSDAALALAEYGQATIITPFTLMGAMTPVRFAAALAQQNAEALFTIALVQSKFPGAPVVYGGFTSNVDMKSGAPAFGTPENSRANIAGGQLARYYNLPYRTSACNASNAVDAQAAYETQMALWGAVMGQGNLIYHAAGWLEGGLVASFEKLIIDAEMVQMMQAMMAAPMVSEADFAFEAMAEAGAGGHFFGTEHTLRHYKTAFYTPLVSDWQNYENWQLAGGLSATERAVPIWQDILHRFEPPPIEASIAEALEAYVARRKEAIGTGEP